MVEVDGILKKGNGGFSSFFPKNMTPQQVIDTINEAYRNRGFVKGTQNTYVGTASSGIKVTMYIDSNGQIISAYPQF